MSNSNRKKIQIRVSPELFDAIQEYKALNLETPYADFMRRGLLEGLNAHLPTPLDERVIVMDDKGGRPPRKKS